MTIKKRGFIFLDFIILVFSWASNWVFADQWRHAISPWRWSFPKDHGSHPEFRTEWWYFTGNLEDGFRKKYGYQLTFFRQGIVYQPKNNSNPWALRDIYIGHFSLTDFSRNKFWFSELISRKGPGLSGASEEGMVVWLLNWQAKMEGNIIRLKAQTKEMELSFFLVPKKPIVLHGENGRSKKGPLKTQASYYYSYTDLKSEGRIKTPESNSIIQVKGISWFDHEFGSNQLSKDQMGWDWFSLHLSDGHDLMIYFLRKKDGSVEQSSSGTLVKRNGEAVHLKLSEIKLEVLDYWKSPKSGGKYPSKWRIKIPSFRIELELNPLVLSQELVTKESTGITYWEGAVLGKGISYGQPIICEGYVELTGYAGSLGGLF